MNNIPILIPIKGASKRCPLKNRKLLPWTIDFIIEQGALENVIVISDCSDLLEYAFSLGAQTFRERRNENQDELQSCYNFIKTTGYREFFLMPVTQPFRRNMLMQDCYTLYQSIQEQVDFITSYKKISNREKFYVHFLNVMPEFKVQDASRKGELCQDLSMIDGALYLIRSDFIHLVANAKDSNKRFWNGRFGCVLNNTPFLDIDTEDDMQQFEFLKNYFNNEKSKYEFQQLK